MKCLHCGLGINNPSQVEQKDQWHQHCVRSFFGTDELPFIEISDQQLEEIASASVERGLTIPGVQKKLSLHHESGDGRGNRLTLVDYPTGYILKPQTPEYKNLPEFEYLAMKLSEKTRVKTVPYALIKLKDSLAYITKRIDRQTNKTTSFSQIDRFAMEDFCQLSERLVEDKYKGSYEACARVIKKFSSRPTLDLSELFLRLIVSFAVGNADMHLKNLSLIENAPASRIFILSQAYDILPVNVVDPRDEEELALSLNAKKNKLTREDFLAFAEYCELPSGAAEKIIAKVCGLESQFIELCQESWLDNDQKAQMIELIQSRVKRLCKS